MKRGLDAPAALAVGLLSLALYTLTLTPTVATNDAGRFQIAAPLLGTGHPTGYPTFILIGKLFTFLPFGDVAYRMNLMAAVFGAVAAALMYLAARRLGASGSVAAGCALLFAFSSTFWSQATIAEVYTMHASFVLGVIVLLLRWREGAGTGTLPLAALVYGVSLGNNAGMVLFAPAFLILAFFGMRVSLWRLLWCVVTFVMGLSVYAYIPIRGFSGAWHNYGDPVNDWNDVWNLVSAARFQGLMSVSPGSTLSGAGDFLYHLSHQTVEPFGYLLAGVLVIGGLCGAVVLVRRDPTTGVSLVVALLCALLYALNYDIDDISVYYIPVYLLLYLLLAVAVSAFSDVTRAGLILLAPLACAALVLGLNFVPSDKSDDYSQRDQAAKTLSRLPEDSVLYAKVPIIPVTYLKEVEGRRTDVTLRWLDGATLERSFERDVESGRPVYFVSDSRYDEEYLPATRSYADPSREGALISFTPK